MKSIFISLIILNTSSYLCDGESFLWKIVGFCPVWAFLPSGCRRNSGGGSNFECRDHLYPCNGELCRAYLYTGLSPIPRGTRPQWRFICTGCCWEVQAESFSNRKLGFDLDACRQPCSAGQSAESPGRAEAQTHTWVHVWLEGGN